MPFAALIPLISAALTGGTALAGGALANRGNKQAAAAQAAAQAEQLAYLREQSAADERRFQQQQALEQSRWDAEQARTQYLDARRDPFRQMAAQRLGFQPPATIGTLARRQTLAPYVIPGTARGTLANLLSSSTR